MEVEEGSDWLKARDEYFLPLVEENAEEWQPRVDKYLDQVEQYELRKSFRGPGTRRRGKPASVSTEPERFLNLARSYYESGDVARAERTLSALSQLLKGDSQFENYRKLADELLDEISTQQSPANRDAFLKESMRRAEQLSKEGKKPEAIAIWTSIIELYDGDPRTAEDVDIARKRLNEEKTAGP